MPASTPRIAHRVIGDDGRAATKWESRIVAWDDLSLDLAGQRVFAVDVDGEEKAAREYLTAAAADRGAAERHAVRQGWLDFFSYADDQIDHETHERLRETLQAESARQQVPLTGSYYIASDVQSAVRAVLSVRAGKPIGFKFTTLVQIAHHLHDRAKAALLPFGCAIKAFDRSGLIEAADKSGKWRDRAALAREGMAMGDGGYLFEEEDHAFLCFLFPDLAMAFDRARLAVCAARERRIAEVEIGAAF